MNPCRVAGNAIRTLQRQLPLSNGTTHAQNLPFIAPHTFIQPGVRHASKLSIQDQLRQLMVHCAQPVAIITTRLSPSSNDKGEEVVEFHGATISSFSSIAMYPHPLISFALQLPSKLATTLRPREAIHPLFVVNILSATQKELAKRFAARDPFLSQPSIPDSQLGLTVEGQPMLLGSLGNLTCRMVKSLPLDFASQEGTLEGKGNAGGQTSELFVARLMRVEDHHYGSDVADSNEEAYPLTKNREHRHHDDPENMRPMVYYQKEFTTVKQ